MRMDLKSSRESVAMWMLAIVVAAGGCRADPYAAIARVVPAAVDSTARTFLAALQSGDITRAESLVAQAQRGPQARVALGQLANVIRARYVVDAIRYNQVRGLPFTAAELEMMLEEVVKNA